MKEATVWGLDMPRCDQRPGEFCNVSAQWWLCWERTCTDRCPSARELPQPHPAQPLVSAGLIPKTTEVDQRSVYVGNVSGRSRSTVPLAVPCAAERMSESPVMEAHPPPTRGWLVPSQMLFLCPAQTGNVAQHLPMILSRLQKISCKCQLPKIPNRLLCMVLHCWFPQGRIVVSWIWVSRLEHSAGKVS